jgi:methyl-accepting chemotaxis protein
VVAGEVRNLAQRAADAAGEIKSLIDDSEAKVSMGSKLVVQAGHTMEDIVTSIQSVTTIVSEISAASVEQNSGIAQVNQAILQMEDVTQQNAALVEQAAASAESLEEQVEHLSDNVAKFKIDENKRAKFSSASLPLRTNAPSAPLQTYQGTPSAAVKPAVQAKSDDEWEEF